MTDPRLAQTVFLGPDAVHQPVGSLTATPNVAVRDAAAAGSSFKLQTADIRQSSRGPLEQGQAIQRAAGPAAAAIAASAKSILAARASVEARLSAPAVPAWGDSGAAYWSIAPALALAERFHKMTPGERAATLAEVRGDPKTNADWAVALLNSPRGLTGITPAEQAALHITVRRAEDPASMAALEVEVQQINSAASAMQRIVDVVVAHGAPRAEITATQEISELFKAEPLAFPDETPPAPRAALHAA